LHSFVTEIRKVLSKISKEKDCDAVNDWIKPCENHLYWSATSTFSGNGMVIWAKFKSFLKHMVNIHTDESNPLFDKCAHEDDIQPRKWLTIGMILQNNTCYKVIFTVINILFNHSFNMTKQFIYYCL
jgi:hypothetical protein